MLDTGIEEAQRLLNAGHCEEALAAFTRLKSVSALRGEAAFYCGIIHASVGRHQNAIRAYNESLQASPLAAAVWNNLGVSLRIAGDLPGAVQAFQQGLLLDPAVAEARSNLGGTLHELGSFQEALRELEAAVAAAPDLSEAKGSLGLAKLLQGDFRAGWQLYEERLRLRAKSQGTLPFPIWDGRPLNGTPIFLRCEQGFGDSIQFVRYAPMVAERGGRVIVGATPELKRLLATAPAVERVVVPGDSLPRCAAQCLLMSLPRLFDTVLETIPSASQYLFSDADAVARWAARFDSQPQPTSRSITKRVGIVWAGAAHNKHDIRRSIPLAGLSRLAGVGAAQLYSLQKGTAAGQVVETGLPIVDWTRELHDFADTAALISNLDLVITVDTAVAHLAGALGKPVWVLIHYSPDWRWLLGRSDSPWYPTMRLFRQPTPGDWDTPIAALEQALRRFVSTPSDNPA